MYCGKRKGKADYQVYENAMSAHALKRLTMEQALNQALDQGELSLHYQPQLDLTNGTITCIEALMRWNSPSLGRIAPLDFVLLAEQTGQILERAELTVC